jgi:hypothetical protein
MSATKNVLLVYFSVICPFACQLNNRAWLNILLHVLKHSETPAICALLQSHKSALGIKKPERNGDTSFEYFPRSLSDSKAKTFEERIAEALSRVDVSSFCDIESLQIFSNVLLRIGEEWMPSMQYDLLAMEIQTWQSNKVDRIIELKEHHYKLLVSRCRMASFEQQRLKVFFKFLQNKKWRLGIKLDFCITPVLLRLLSRFNPSWFSSTV